MLTTYGAAPSHTIHTHVLTRSLLHRTKPKTLQIARGHTPSNNKGRQSVKITLPRLSFKPRLENGRHLPIVSPNIPQTFRRTYRLLVPLYQIGGGLLQKTMAASPHLCNTKHNASCEKQIIFCPRPCDTLPPRPNLDRPLLRHLPCDLARTFCTISTDSWWRLTKLFPIAMSFSGRCRSCGTRYP